MIVSLTLTTQTTLALVTWHVHVMSRADDGDEPQTAVHGGMLPLAYGEASILTPEVLLRACADAIGTPYDAPTRGSVTSERHLSTALDSPDLL